MEKEKLVPVGRFAPSPTGRMHLGNIYTAYRSWRSVREHGGRWILRIEDLDPGRSRYEYARQIEDDLMWLGLDWDEGGLDDRGMNGPYSQSRRGDIYKTHFDRLCEMGLVYGCQCRRADILATQAPHQSDGRVVYAATCRTLGLNPDGRAARLVVPDREVSFADRYFGICTYNLAKDCGDFIIKRADCAWGYQLAVVVDDALMGVTEVVRGADLLLSTAQQIYIYELFGYPVPEFAHLPLIANSEGVRLSKRDAALSMETLRREHTPSSLRSLLEELSARHTLTGFNMAQVNLHI